jgi:hypothetical protein
MVASMSVSVVSSSAIPEVVAIRLCSVLPGRYRIWVAGLYQNQELARAIEGALARPSSHRALKINLIRGTLLLETGAEERVEDLVQELEAVLLGFAEAHAVPLFELQRRSRASAASGAPRGWPKGEEHERLAPARRRGGARAEAAGRRRAG